MRQTLLHIPNEIAGMPVFGFGILLAIWSVFGVGLMIWTIRRHGFQSESWADIPILVVIGVVIWFVLPRLCDPVGLPIRGYGVMLLVAVASAVGLAAWRAHRRGIDVELIYTLAFWAFVPGILGARLFYVIQKWPTDFAPIYAEQGLGAFLGSLVNIAQGGIVLYGSLIGGMAGLLIFLIKYKLPLLTTLDLVAPSMMLGLAIGRLGCFLNGCCYGGVCELPWAVRFPAGSPPHIHQIQSGEAFLHGLKIAPGPRGEPVIVEVEPGSAAEREGLEPGQTITSLGRQRVESAQRVIQVLLHAHAGKSGESESSMPIIVQANGQTRHAILRGPPGRGAPVHPTQIYSTISALLVCLLLLKCEPFCRRDGMLWTIMLSIYPVTRFLIEIIRTDEGSAFGTGLTISQNVSLLLLVVATGFWFYIFRKPAGRSTRSSR